MDCWYREKCVGAESGCENGCIKFVEMKHLLENSGLPKKFQGPVKIHPSRVDEEEYQLLWEIADDIESFVKDGENLIIMSKRTGNGKTTWACKLLTKYLDRIAIGNAFRDRALFVSFTDFKMRCKNFDDKEFDLVGYRKRLENVDLVVWDDIADTELTDYEYRVFMQILEQRLSKGLSNIYTSNMVGKELEGYVGKRLYSRMVNGSVQIEFHETDKRGIW